jgi:phage tail tape-measure protein
MKIDNLRTYLEGLQNQISSGSINELDFDTLSERLTDFVGLVSEHELQTAELNELREDYCRRIAGMAKAIAVAERKAGKLKEAEELIDSLKTLGARELINLYGKTQARFHDTFPSSFGILRARRRSVRSDQFKEFK